MVMTMVLAFILQIFTWNTDAWGYGSGTTSLYQSHPWVFAVLPNGEAIGFLADTTRRCEVKSLLCFFYFSFFFFLENTKEERLIMETIRSVKGTHLSMTL